jgi:hypothetical protein
MERKELIKRYTRLHGNLLGQKEGLYIKVASLIKSLDYDGVTDRYKREIEKINLIEKELGWSKEMEELKSLTTSLFQPATQQAANRTAA